MTKKIKDLNPAEYNPRKISDKQLELLNKSMKEYGDLSGIVFNVATGNIIGGHQRTKLLNPEAIIQKEDCQDETGTTAIGYVITSEGKFSYREVNWTEQKEKAANIAANKGGGEWDFTKLKDLMEDLDTGELDLELTGFDNQEIEKLMIFTPESEKENLDNINPAIELINLTEDLKLFISLISAKLKINLRTPLRFFTLYNMTVKDFDSLKAIKKNCDESTIEIIANETVKVLIQIYGNLSNFTICPAPQGSQTKKNGKHFATNICNKIGEILNIPVLEIFNKNSKTKFGQSNKSLIDIVNVPDNIIFFDDVHTTGQTLTSCLNLIRHKFVIPIVFIDNNI